MWLTDHSIASPLAADPVGALLIGAAP